MSYAFLLSPIKYIRVKSKRSAKDRAAESDLARHSRHTIQGAIEPRTSINRRGRKVSPRVESELEQRNDRRINRSTHCAPRRSRVYTCSACRKRRCVRELVTREASVHRVHTYWLSSYNGYASGEAGSIHSCSARTSGLPFTISHLPFTILLERACFNHCNPLSLSLSLSLALSLRGLQVREKEREREREIG